MEAEAKTCQLEPGKKGLHLAEEMEAQELASEREEVRVTDHDS